MKERKRIKGRKSFQTSKQLFNINREQRYKQFAYKDKMNLVLVAGIHFLSHTHTFTHNMLDDPAGTETVVHPTI